MTGKSIEDIKKVVDRMTPDEKLLHIYRYDFKDFYSDKELDDMFFTTATIIASILINTYKEYQYEDDAYQWALNHRDSLMDLIGKGWALADVIYSVLMESGRLDMELEEEEEESNESIRDKMIPKSEEDINKDIQKQFLEHEWDEIGWENLVKYWFNGNDKLREWIEKQFVKPELERFKDFIKREYHYKQEYYSNPEFNKIMKNSKLFSTRFSRFFSKNEGVKDMMTPLPKEEVKKKILKNPELYLKKYKEYLSKEEIYDIVEKMGKGDKIKAVLFDVPELFSDDDKREAIGKLSKEVRHEFILGRFCDLYTEEEQEEHWKDAVMEGFEMAHKNGKRVVNLDWLGSKWEKYSAPYKIDDEIYLYKGKKMKIYSVESGSWYIYYLTVIDK
jgi:hypothetical protein